MFILLHVYVYIQWNRDITVISHGVEEWINAMVIYGNSSYRSSLSKVYVEFSKDTPPVWPYFDNLTLHYAVVFCKEVLVMNTKAMHYK